MFNIIYSVCDANPDVLEKHIKIWKSIPTNIITRLRFFIIDDCSKIPLSLNIDFPINLTIPRITTDIYWNPPGAKNLGFLLADNDWTFSCDIDHFTPVESFEKMLSLDKKRNNLYLFERFLPNGESRRKNTPNIFIIHREDFWKTGGYDEDFSGYHGFDDYVFIGNLFAPHLPSLIKNLGIEFIQTNIPIIEHKEYETGDTTKKIASHKYSEPLMYKKLDELSKRLYKHGSIIRFQWEILKEYNI